MLKSCKFSILLALFFSIYANADVAFEREIDASKTIYSMEVRAEGFRVFCRDTSSIKNLAKIDSVNVVDSIECRVLSPKRISFDSNGVRMFSRLENGYLLLLGSGDARFSIYAEDIKMVNQKEEFIAGEPGVFKKILPLAAPYLIASGVLLAIVYIGLSTNPGAVK